jgi:hypothetical protein
MKYGTDDYSDLLRQIVQPNGKRHDLYKTTCAHAEAMGVHIYGDKPTDLLQRVRPREPDEIKKYREENYEPTTKSTANRGLSILAKIFNPWLYEIKWPDQSVNGKKLEDFTLQYYPRHNSIVSFLAQAGLKKMIADPNGVFAIKPKRTPQTDQEMVEPEVKVFGSHAIWYYDQDHFLIHLKEETSPKKWDYFQYYDNEQIIDFKVRVINSKSVEIVELDQYYHGFNDIPVWFLSGETETTDEGLEYYKSFFEPALPFWNKAINNESDLDAHIIMHIHPQKVVTGEDCDFVDATSSQRCQHGKIPDGKGDWKTCPACKGAGRVVPIGPFGIHVVNREKLLEGAPTVAPVSYVTVPTEPTQLLKERVEEMHNKGLEALNMDIVDKVGENQSGIAKIIDRGELYDFLHKVSSVMFNTHLENFFYFFKQYMFQVYDQSLNKKRREREQDKDLPEINKPAFFDLSSVPEMTLEYAEAKKATMPGEYLRQKQIAITAKEYASTPEVKRKLIAIIELDPLPEITSADMDLKLSLATISRKDAVIHDNIGPFIDRALSENKDFFQKTKQEKLEVLGKYADEFMKKNRVTLTEDDGTEGSGQEAGRKVA